MQFITSLIGGSGNSLLTALFALGIVLVLIVLGVWLLKLLFAASSRATRGRNPRLGVVESLSIDPKRQLLIIRRDNVDHLILTGGPQDLLIETGIAVDEAAVAAPARRPIPMVAPRKPAPAAAPGAAVAAAAPIATPPAAAKPAAMAPAPVAAEPPGAPGTVLAELQKQGLPTGKRAHLSLRHTGLLRPISEMELPVSPEIAAPSARPGLDSAKEEFEQRENEGADLADGSSETQRN